MDRRTYVRTVAASATFGGLAGCLGSGSSHPHTTLDEPKREFDSEAVQYTAWGERIPAVSLPAPLENREVGVRKDVETPSLITFFFSHCKTVCPVLISTLGNIQAHALQHDYIDEVTFLPVTFDPQRDDADRLRTYAKNMHIDTDASWHFLRPPSKRRAKTVIEEQFGVVFERTASMPGMENMNDNGYMFIHTALTLLVNADGYVERAYRTKSPSANEIIADLKKLR